MPKAQKATAQTKHKKTSRPTTKRVPKKSSAHKPQKKVAKKSDKTSAKKNTKQKKATSPQKKTRPKKKDTLKTNKPLRLPHSVSLSRLNPFRLPIPIDQLVVGTARYVGLAFVFFGALLTMHHLQALVYLDVIQQQALLSQQECKQIEADKWPSECHDYNQDSQQKRLDARITFGEPQPAHGNVEVNITLPDVPATADVQLLGRYATTDTDESFTVGSPEHRTGEEWSLVWDTNKQFTTNGEEYPLYEDGSYYLSVDVQYTIDNVYTHENMDWSANGLFEIKNTTRAETDSSTSSVNTNDTATETNETEQDTTIDTNDTTGIDTQPDSETRIIEDIAQVPIEITVPSELPVSGVATIHIKGQGLTGIQIELLDLSSREVTKIGAPQERENDTWSIKFDSTTFKNGEYRIRTLLNTPNDTYVSDTYKDIQIQNDVTVDEAKKEDGTITEAEESTLTPSISISAMDTQPLSGYTDIIIKAENVDFVEIYSTPRYSSVKKFVGLATKLAAGQWRYRWNTVDIPNGEHTLTAKVRNTYGVHEGGSTLVSVRNAIQEHSTFESDNTVESEVHENAIVSGEGDFVPKPLLPEKQDGEGDLGTNDQEAEVGVESNNLTVTTLMDNYSEEINEELRRLRTALRSEDEQAIAQSKKRLTQLRERIILAAEANSISEAELDALQSEVLEIFQRFVQDVERTERIVQERVAAEINTDSDKDGITDYDEINIYNTDPKSADSDGDGFTDGAEILNGYNPLDPQPEVYVTFESPKETGVEREDLIEVSTVEPIVEELPDTDQPANKKIVQATVITGKALPNSFVTIYIYSTPIVATVRTNDDGSWKYRFEKELEDGEHVVYAGVTDNAGRIVAKSQPFTFVKTAQAFTPTEAASASVTTESDSLFETQTVILVVLSISVVAVGVVLIYVGLHLSTRPRRFTSTDIQTSDVV